MLAFESADDACRDGANVQLNGKKQFEFSNNLPTLNTQTSKTGNKQACVCVPCSDTISECGVKSFLFF